MKFITALLTTLIITVVGLAQSCTAQQPTKNSAKSTSVTSYRTTIDQMSGVPMVQVKINGVGPYSFILDTGSNETIISHELARQLGVQASETQYNSATVSGPIILNSLGNLNISLLDSGYKKITNVLMPSKLSASYGQIKKVFSIADGVLGLNFFCNSTIILDGPTSELIIRPNSHPKSLKIIKSRNCYYSDDGTSFRPTFPVEILGKKVSVFADTGDVINKEMVFNSTPINDVLWQKLATNYGLVTAERFSGKRLKIAGVENVKFGHEKPIANLVILLVDPNEDSSPYAFYKELIGNTELDAIMGWKLLKEGILTIDTNAPSSSSFYFAKTYYQEYNKSGLRKIMFPTPSTLMIQEIATYSPADNAGFRKGDLVVQINGRNVANTEFLWLTDTVYGRNGKTMKITFIRDGKTLTKTIFLNDYLFDSITKK